MGGEALDLGAMRLWAAIAYGLGIVALGAAFWMKPERPPAAVHSLQRALSRGEVAPALPRLDASDAMANAAVLNAVLAEVVHPDFPGVAPDRNRACTARARSFAILLDGRLSRVRFGARSVCQLQLLKQISVAQPGFGPRGVAEVAAFVLGRRLHVPGQAAVDVDVTRIVVPPFRFGDATLTFASADLGPLADGELFIGTYHTHPEGDITQGVLSETDLEYMQRGFVDFAGQIGTLGADAGVRSGRLDWLFDIVDPREGDWNVYAHDAVRLRELATLCTQKSPPCPLNELRIAGSRFHLLARTYDERDEDAP